MIMVCRLNALYLLEAIVRAKTMTKVTWQAVAEECGLLTSLGFAPLHLCVATCLAQVSDLSPSQFLLLARYVPNIVKEEYMRSV